MEVIERLMDQEYRYGDPEYSELGKEASAISLKLSEQLDAAGKGQLEELLDIEMQRNVLVQEDAFEVGVCIGVKFMCEVLGHE